MVITMTSQMKYVTIATTVVGSLGFLFLAISVFSSSWIRGHYPPYHNVTRYSSTVIGTNISASCAEGLFTVCCEINLSETNRTIQIYLTEQSCSSWQKDDFTGTNLSAFRTVQAFAAMAFICSCLWVSLPFLFLASKRLPPTLMICQIFLLYVTGILFVFSLILMSSSYHQFSDMEELTTGWCVSLGSVAAVFILVTAGVVSWMYVTFKGIITSYENI